MQINNFKDVQDNIRDVSFLIYPILPERCITILASQGGVGKSGLALYYSELLLKEGKSVLYIDAESGGSHMKKRLNDWNLKNCIDRLQITTITSPDGSVQTGAPVSEDDLKNTLAQGPFDLVIIDSLTLSTKGMSTDKRSIMAEYMSNLSKHLFDYSTTFLILAHINKKQDVTKSNTVHDISGSAAIVDLARSVLLLDYANNNEKDPGRILKQVKQNLTAKADPIQLQLTETGILYGDSKLTPTTTRKVGKITDAEIYRQTAVKVLTNLESTKQDVVRALTELEKPASPSECSRAIDYASKLLNINWEK